MHPIEFENADVHLSLSPIKDSETEDTYILQDERSVNWLTIRLEGREFQVIEPEEPKIRVLFNWSMEELKERLTPHILDIMEQEQSSGTEMTEMAASPPLEESDSMDPYNPDDIKVMSRQFNLRLVKEMIDSGDLDLNPDFQRHFVWDNPRRSRLIESILLRIPLPMFYFSEDKEGKLTVIDGLQRITTINDFLNDKFALKDLEYLKDSCQGKKYSTLDPKYIRWFNLTQLSSNVIDPSSPYQVKYDIFRRINTGGKPLNNQEIRNCLAGDNLRKTLREMVALEEFRRATNHSVKSIRMADEELALRFILFRELFRKGVGAQGYNGYMDASLDEITEALRKEPKEHLNVYIEDFSRAMKNAEYLFGKYAFRKIEPDALASSSKKQLINKALFVCWSVLLANYDPEKITDSNERLQLLMPLSEEIRDNSEFKDYLSRGTNGKANILYVFSKAQEIIDHHLIY